jgi:flavin-dependent dehydrogenase
MQTFDVVVIGAGLAGLQCSKLLAERGAAVLLVDRKHDLTTAVHTTGIFVRKTLEDFDFPAGTLGQPISNVTLYSPKLRRIPLESEKPEFQIGKMAALYTSYLNDCIKCGVEFAEGTRYVSAEKGAGETIVALEKGRKAFRVKTKVLVGADGANSRVARDLGLDENKEWIVGCEEVFQANDNPREPRLHCFLDAKLAPGYLAWIADDGEEVHVGVGGYAKRFEPRIALQEFKLKMADLLDSCCVTGEAPIETRGGRIPVGGVLKRISNENGVLIGDAAGAVSPLTAGGLDPCLRLSAMAAGVITERLLVGDAQILRVVSGERFRSRFIARIWMRRIISAVTSQNLLEAACWALDQSVGRRLARHVFFGRGSFPDVSVPVVSDKKLAVG